MQIRELQEYLKDRLNAVEALMQGGCKAFAEDTRTVYDEPGYVVDHAKPNFSKPQRDDSGCLS